jgi:hypothetical protein
LVVYRFLIKNTISIICSMNPDLYSRLMDSDHHSHDTGGAPTAIKDGNDAAATSASTPSSSKPALKNMESTNNTTSHFPFSTDKDEIYEYYKNNLIPALTSSLPLLLRKIREDSGSIVYKSLMKIVHLLIPFTREDFEWHAPQVPHVATEVYGNLTQFLLNQFDSDHDGTYLECSES